LGERMSRGALAAILIAVIVAAAIVLVAYRGGGRPSAASETAAKTSTVAASSTTVMGQNAANLPVVRVGTLRGGVSSMDVILALKLDKKYGFRLEPHYFTSTLDLANALSKGDIDIAIIPAEFVAKLREHGANITILAVDFYQNQAIVVRKDVNTTSIEQLRGARVGVFEPTGTYAMFLAYMRSIYHIDPQSYFNLVNAPPPQLVQAFARGDVDAVVIWEPFVSKLVGEFDGRILISYKRLWSMWDGHVGDNGVMIVYAANAKWAWNHPRLVEKLLKARSAAAREWNSNETLATSILEKNYGLNAGAARLCWKRLKMEESEKLTEIMVKNILAVWELAREGGYITKSPEELAKGGAFWAGQH
jgi:NitT/TauT family transport system substrate-binding protein